MTMLRGRITVFGGQVDQPCGTLGGIPNSRLTEYLNISSLLNADAVNLAIVVAHRLVQGVTPVRQHQHEIRLARQVAAQLHDLAPGYDISRQPADVLHGQHDDARRHEALQVLLQL